jgi:hypothetical protein
MPPRIAGALPRRSRVECERLLKDNIRSGRQGLDWIGFAFLQVGFSRLIGGLCGFLIFGDVWCWRLR